LTQVEQFLKEHPEITDFPSVPQVQEMYIKHFNSQNSPEQHQVNLMKYISNAREQTKTPQFKFETRVVEYTEKFYSKFCKVELTSDQINDIRINWKQYNEANSGDTIEKMSEEKLINVDFDKLPENKEISICSDCHTGFWVRVEHQFDFYMLEEMNGGMLVGTRNSQGKEYVFFIKKTSETKYCECGHCCYDLDKKFDKVSYTLIINPTKQIKENLSEELRGQKYLSTDNTQIAYDGGRKADRKQKLIKKGTLRQSDSQLEELNLKREQDGNGGTRIVPNGSNFSSNHVALWIKHVDEELIKTAISIPLKLVKPIVNVPVSFMNPLKIFSNGYGQDSVTEIVLNHVNWDQIVFSDTGAEQIETYEFIEKFLVQLPKVTRYKMRIVHSRYGNIYTYYNDRPNPMTPMYTKRDCTEKFKIEPIKQWIKGKYGLNPMSFRGKEIQDEFGNVMKNPDYDTEERGSKKLLYNHKIILGLGINAEEARRAHYGNVWYIKNVFPLIEKKIGKTDEEQLITACGFECPTKSGCFFCFFGNKAYYCMLRRKHPEQYDMAVNFYEEAKAGSEARRDNGGMRLELVKFPTDEEFAEYMRKFPTCGDSKAENGCDCMTGNNNSGMTRGRAIPEDEDAMNTKPAYIGGNK